MKWFRHEANASRELPVRQILADMGFYGLGVFWTIMERVVWNDGKVTAEELEREFCSRRFPKAKVRQLIEQYGVFRVDEFGRVRRADTTTVVTTDSPTVMTTDMTTDMTTVMTTVSDSNAPAYRSQPWYPYVSSLLDEPDGQIWRETVAMQSGYGELLLRHWPVAVQEFAKHITSYDTGRDIYSVQRARYYFMSFVRGNTKTGAALKEVLQYLDSYGR